MARYLRKRKTPIVLLLIIITVALFLLIANHSKESVCTDYQIMLPEGYFLQRDSKTKDSLILCNNDIVGGVLHCPFSKGLWGTVEAPQLYPLDRIAIKTVTETLKAADAPGTNPHPSDYMDYWVESGGGMYSCIGSFINRNAEYKHYMVFFEDGILSLWFDTSLVDSKIIDSIANNFSVVP